MNSFNHCNLSVFLILLCFLFVNISSFNLDTLDYAQYHGDKDSMFGFSVAAHREHDYNWVIIGAPQAQTVQPGVVRGGTVFMCPSNRDDDCRELPFDRKGNNNSSSNNQIDEKSYQWFGATVNSGGPDKPIVACAPRYLWYTLKADRRDPVGTCFVSSSNLREFKEFSPCRTRHWGYHRQGTCQAGLGAAISKSGDRLFVGAPGSWYWQGQMYSIDPEANLPFSPPRYSEYGTVSAGQMYSQHLKQRPAVFFTKEGQPMDDDSYLGYSVAAGNFTGERDGGFAAGMPRGNKLVGKVLLYTWNLTNYQNVSGSQIGAYFGYAIAAADVNGDGLDDLIIGAPLHTEPNNEKKYEVGRIYVMYPERQDGVYLPRIKKFDKIDGVNSRGRFGLSVACLGDLDLDGYQDIAVGAPYDGELGMGAVYIYYGSKKGIRSKVSQIIRAEDVSQTAMYTFGFSVAGNGIDLDTNQYPDLVVGAYASNTAFLFRARPVINVDAKVQFNTHNHVIGLEERNCTLHRGKKVACTSLSACVIYNGVGVSNGISLIMEFTLDAKKTKDRRMFLYPTEVQHKFNETWSLRRNDRQCKNMQVYIRENTRDKLTPLDVEMRYYLADEQQNNEARLYHRRNPRSNLSPILNGNLPSVLKDSITIRKNCGSDDVCIPDLRIHIKPNVDKYLLGSGERLDIDVIVKNEGEDSFESMFYMKIPPGVNYININQTDDLLKIPIKCSPPSEINNNTLKCDIGNPLPTNKLVHFVVMLDPFNMEGMRPSYDFSMKVNSTNPEVNSSIYDNVYDLSIDIWVQTNLSLTGWPQIPDIHYKKDQYKEDNYTNESEIGPQIVHIYGIRNNGPSNINEADVLFLWPSETLGGDDLLYLMDQPETSGAIKCQFVSEVNPLQVDLSSKKYYLKTDKSVSASRVSSEEKITTNVASSGGSSAHDRRQEEAEEKYHETGDGSHIHLYRGKERKQQQQGSSSSSSSAGGFASSSGSSSSSSTSTSGGATTITKTETSWETSSSGSDGAPVRTWSSRNQSSSSTSTSGSGSGSSGYGQGQVQVHGQHQNTRGGGQQQSGQEQKYKIHYTSTGTGQQVGTRFGAPDVSDTQERTFTVSDRQNLDHTNFTHMMHYPSQSTMHHYGKFDEFGPVEPEIPGRVHSQSSSSSGTGWSTSSQSGSRWSDSTRTSGSTSSGNVPVEHDGSSGGSQSTYFNWDDGSAQSLNVNTDQHRGTEQRHHGSHTDEISVNSSGSGYVTGSGEIVYGQQGGGVIGQQHHHQQQQHHFNQQQGGGSRTGGGYTYENRDSQQHHHQQQGATIDSGSRDYDYENRNRQQQHHHHQVISEHGTTYGSGLKKSDNVFRDFYHLSGQDLRQLISEEDLKRMLDTGSGEYHNGTHRIRWSTNQYGTITMHNDTVRPFSISTEESVNQYLDEYTRTVTQQGRHQTGGGGGSYGSSGGSYTGGSSISSSSSNVGGGVDSAHHQNEFSTGSISGAGVASIAGGSNNEFRTGTLDLGVLSSNAAGATTHHETDLHYDPDLDSYEDRSAERQGLGGSVSYGSSRTFSGGSSSGSSGAHQSQGHGQGQNRHQESHRSSSHFSTSYSSSSGSGGGHFVGDNVPTEHPADMDYRNRIYRGRRQTNDDDFSHIIECKSTKCSMIKCKAGPLAKDEEAWAALRFRANVVTMKKIGWTQPVTLSSMMISRINKLPYIGTPNERPVHTHEVFTNVTYTETEIKPDVVPLWVVVLSACAGAIILLLVAFLLYKCGFFKRNRPSDAPERQPLNRNGHYQGDEQL